MQERETVMDGSAMPGDVAQQATATSEPRRPRVVIVGAGFGGLEWYAEALKAAHAGRVPY
jgi:hypothetical protein